MGLGLRVWFALTVGFLCNVPSQDPRCSFKMAASRPAGPAVGRQLTQVPFQARGPVSKHRWVRQPEWHFVTNSLCQAQHSYHVAMATPRKPESERQTGERAAQDQRARRQWACTVCAPLA